MGRAGTKSGTLLVAVLLAASGCATVASQEAAFVRPPPSTATTTRPPPPRLVVEQAWTPFATVGGITLVHPSARVERIGFHEAHHDGARQMEPLPTAAAPVTLETRNRLTGSRTAADVVVDPELEIRAPVSGRVRWAGTYVLYCDYSDDYVVIDPDDHPGWQVKMFHIDGVQVRAGTRVIAGETGALFGYAGVVVLIGVLLWMILAGVIDPGTGFVLFIALRMLGQTLTEVAKGLMRYVRARAFSEIPRRDDDEDDV